MDAAALVASFSTGTYTVTRRARVTWVAGIATPGATSTLTIDASIQPATGRDLLQLPEGRRSLETRVIYTTTPLVVGIQDGASESDMVAIDGASWEVRHVEKWAGHYRVIAQASP